MRAYESINSFLSLIMNPEKLSIDLTQEERDRIIVATSGALERLQNDARPSIEDAITLVSDKIRTVSGQQKTDLENLRAYLLTLKTQKNDIMSQTQGALGGIVVSNERNISVNTPSRTSLYTGPDGKPTAQTGTKIDTNLVIAPSESGDALKGKAIYDALVASSTIKSTVDATLQGSLRSQWEAFEARLTDAQKQ